MSRPFSRSLALGAPSMATMLRSLSSSAARRLLSLSRSITTIPNRSASFTHTSRSSPAPPSIHPISDRRVPSVSSFMRSFSASVGNLPPVSDPDVENAFKDLMAMSWDDIPDSVLTETKKALSKETEDKAGKEALANVFRAAVASVEFGAILVSLRMALDDLCGLTGENVGRLPEDLEEALKAAYTRYMRYLDSFGPDEAYLRKKVEMELGMKMIHLKMRCSGIGSEWGKAKEKGGERRRSGVNVMKGYAAWHLRPLRVVRRTKILNYY